MPQGNEEFRLTVETVVDDRRWDEVGLDVVCRSACEAALKTTGYDRGQCEIGILGCSDEKIAGLNRRFRNVHGPTNVLAWPAGPTAVEDLGVSELGNIAVAFETCMMEAKAQGKRPASHLAHLIVHACLHLVGFDHESEDEAEVMEAMELASLARLGIVDPIRLDGGAEMTSTREPVRN